MIHPIVITAKKVSRKKTKLEILIEHAIRLELIQY